MAEEVGVARAFGDEPVLVKIVAITNGTATVARTDKDADQSIGWPVRDLYVFEEALHRKLRQTFVRGDAAALRVIWSEAIPYARRTGYASRAEKGQDRRQAREKGRKRGS